MDKKCLYIGLGGKGRKQINEILSGSMNEPERKGFVIVDCSKEKESMIDSKQITMEENCNE